MRIEGTVALVTGGASGLGRATAQVLAEAGARVGVLDFNIDAAQQVATGIDGHAVRCDVTDDADVSAAVRSVADTFGAPARIVVNCAGIADAARMFGRGGALGTSVFRKVIGVNLIGSYNVMAHATALMLEAEPLPGEEQGVLINTASAAYEDGQVGQSAYAASKGAIASMCLPLAREMAKQGVRVMAIAPGLFHTPMMEGLPEEVSAKIVANIPFPARLGDPREFGQMAADIVRNPYLNGTIIRLDGAVRLPPR